MHSAESEGHINLLRMRSPAHKAEQTYKDNKSELSQVIISIKEVYDQSWMRCRETLTIKKC